MIAAPGATGWESRLWIAGLVVLALARVPAFVAPAGSDQHLYMYVADRILAGGAPYVDAWDQKPPGVHVAYAMLRVIWADESTVALMDLLTALGTAALLILVGVRLSGLRTGYLAATVFLLFGDPSIARLDGLYLRGQCETLIALATTAGMALVWKRAPGQAGLIAAGAFFGTAVWVKYNAVTYALPIFAAAMTEGPGGPRDARKPGWLFTARTPAFQAAWLAAGAALVSLPVLIFLWVHGAVGDWWLATIDYNLRYSGETYANGWIGGVEYALLMPVHRFRMDFLWFAAAVGFVLVVTAGRHVASSVTLPIVLWFLAALGSILLNGARDLPQYFLQAKPVLALAFALGVTTLAHRARVTAALTALLLAAGLWRVGTDAPGALGLRWGGLPQVIDNMTFDLAYARGRIDRPSYLARFTALQKYDAAESDALTAIIRSTTDPAEPIFVFGFSPGVYLESGRTSASRFFWSRPVILEFGAGHDTYGSRGLLADLERARPSIVALQKKDWGPGEPTSYEFMLNTPHLRSWLERGYTPERETPFYSLWRRRP